jgi:hypothetical protein
LFVSGTMPEPAAATQCGCQPSGEKVCRAAIFGAARGEIIRLAPLRREIPLKKADNFRRTGTTGIPVLSLNATSAVPGILVKENPSEKAKSQES